MDGSAESDGFGDVAHCGSLIEPSSCRSLPSIPMMTGRHKVLLRIATAFVTLLCWRLSISSILDVVLRRFFDPETLLLASRSAAST